MFQKYILVLIFNTISIFAIAQTVDIPKGVVYKYADDKVNEKAKSLISKELNKPSYKTFYVMVCMGPNLRERFKNIPEIENIVGDLTLRIPVYDTTGNIKRYDVMTGKFLQSKEDFKIVWDELVKNFKGKEIEFRKPTNEELKYYWKTIPFDIEEPIYVLVIPGFKLLIDVSSKNNIEWIEELH